MMTHVISQIEDCETAGDVCKSINVLQAIRWIAQAWEAVEPSIIVKCFTHAGVLDKERNLVKALAPPSDKDPFSDLEDDVLQVNALLEDFCGDTATSADEAIAEEHLLPVCQEVDENWSKNSFQVCHKIATMKTELAMMKKSWKWMMYCQNH